MWPDVARPLEAMLRRRGIAPHDTDEIVQETATRAYAGKVPFTDADDLFRWASVVGWRLAIDLRRRREHMSAGTMVPEQADPVDVAVVAEHRVMLGAVGQRLTQLSARDREVLLSSFHDGPVRTRVESVRLAVARHRARARLRALLDGVAAPVFALWARRPRLASAPAEGIAFLATPAACVLIGAIALTGGSPQPQPAELATRSPHTVVASAAPAPVGDTGAAAPRVERPVATDPHVSALPKSKNESTNVAVPTPNGDQAEAGVRDKVAEDELVCVDPPSIVGGQTTCVKDPLTK